MSKGKFKSFERKSKKNGNHSHGRSESARDSVGFDFLRHRLPSNFTFERIDHDQEAPEATTTMNISQTIKTPRVGNGLMRRNLHSEGGAE